MSRHILVARPADAANFNPQAKNAQNILRFWQSTTLRPAIIAFTAPEPTVASNPNVDIIRIKPNRLWRIALIVTYLKRFDAIFYPGLHIWADWFALKLRAAMGRRIKVIATMEGLLGQVDSDTRQRRFCEFAGHQVYCQPVAEPVVRRMEAILEMADHIIAISPFLGKMARLRYGNKVSVLPLGVDTAVFRRTGFERRARPRVVGAGGVRAHKRPELFVELARTFPQADFVWFGEGELRQPLQAQALHESLANLSFPGPLPHAALGAEFARSDIFVLPSLGEGVPKVTQEAAAAGLAQIVFGFYEAPTVNHGSNGFVVWSDAELITRLRMLIEDRDLTERMGRAGMDMAADWSWEKVAPQWEARIHDIVEGVHHAG